MNTRPDFRSQFLLCKRQRYNISTHLGYISEILTITESVRYKWPFTALCRFRLVTCLERQSFASTKWRGSFASTWEWDLWLMASMYWWVRYTAKHLKVEPYILPIKKWEVSVPTKCSFRIATTWRESWFGTKLRLTQNLAEKNKSYQLIV